MTIPAEDDVVFPDDPDFTQGFLVVDDDAQAVRRLFGPHTRLFLTQRINRMFRSNGRWLLMCRLNKRPKPRDYRAFVDEVSEGMLVMTGARL